LDLCVRSFLRHIGLELEDILFAYIQFQRNNNPKIVKNLALENEGALFDAMASSRKEDIN
jgi:hypothetical protein